VLASLQVLAVWQAVHSVCDISTVCCSFAAAACDSSR
jgi:hypothetical protein